MKELFQLIGFILLPLLVGGIIRKTRSRAQNRKGPSITQVLRDIYRNLQKQAVVSSQPGFFIEYAPMIAIMGSLIAWSIVAFEWTSFVFIVFFLVLERVALTGFASENGTSFGGMGSSRETLLSISTEPTLLLMILVAQSHIQMDASITSFSMGALFLVACFYAVLVELSKPPFDDPRTHLELTMVHEAMLLEASGRKFAMFEISYQIKSATMLTLLVKLGLEHTKFHKNDYLSPSWIPFWVIPAVLLSAVGLGIWEAFCARRKWSWVPELMGLIFLVILFLGTLVKLHDI
ncbi:MAG: NADH-quinone oxidoreductase subunit H [Leptospiraceae bacterium]|nr:NADH-quinone oxidoreductase subunit H [Leptospiraceae bacterium]MCZ8347712.1 NADH-quinone oxidoreductase subunit H [Leptospiraceae bacterium]PJE04034.1 MAG: formate hydrogenase [Leptospira sp.]